MAKTTNQHQTTIVTSSKRYPVTACVRRKLQTMFLDNENVFKTAMYPDFNMQDEARAIAMMHYQEQRQELDLISKGVKPLPGHNYSNDNSGTEDVTYALYYGHSWNMRAIKRLLLEQFEMEGMPQGKVTNECGVFQFRVNGITKQEAMKVYTDNMYKSDTKDGLFVNVYVPDALPAGNRVSGMGGKQRVKPLVSVRGSSVTTTHQAEEVFSSEPTTRRATTGELAIYNAAKPIEQDIVPVEPDELDELTEL